MHMIRVSLPVCAFSEGEGSIKAGGRTMASTHVEEGARNSAEH
jgi:hypothetical protein